MTEAIKNGKDPFADEKAGAGKGKKGGSAGAGATEAPQETPQVSPRLPKPHLLRLLRRNSPARPSTKPPSAYRQSSANSPNSKSRKPILSSKWPRTTPATTRA